MKKEQPLGQSIDKSQKRLSNYKNLEILNLIILQIANSLLLKQCDLRTYYFDLNFLKFLPNGTLPFGFCHFLNTLSSRLLCMIFLGYFYLVEVFLTFFDYYSSVFKDIFCYFKGWVSDFFIVYGYSALFYDSSSFSV